MSGFGTDTKGADALRICPFCAFTGRKTSLLDSNGREMLPGILSGLAVIIGLKMTLPVISHGIAFFRILFLHGLFQCHAEAGRPGAWGMLLPGTPVIPFQLRNSGNHLNRIHFEIGLQSVCCVNPSLDVYFNSAEILLLIISAEYLGKITHF